MAILNCFVLSHFSFETVTPVFFSFLAISSGRFKFTSEIKTQLSCPLFLFKSTQVGNICDFQELDGNGDIVTEEEVASENNVHVLSLWN